MNSHDAWLRERRPERARVSSARSGVKKARERRSLGYQYACRLDVSNFAPYIDHHEFRGDFAFLIIFHASQNPPDSQ
jgi:hypothetical protein